MNNKQEIISKEECGCEFTTYYSEDGCNSYTILTKCKCQKHYDGQFEAEYYDHEGLHQARITPANILPLEAEQSASKEVA